MIMTMMMTIGVLSPTGILDGVGTELGGSALLLVIAKFVHELLRERRTKRSAQKVVSNGQEQRNNTNTVGNPKRPNGSTSTNLILNAIDDHTVQFREIRQDLKKAFEDHTTQFREIHQEITDVAVKLAKIEGQHEEHMRVCRSGER